VSIVFRLTLYSLTWSIPRHIAQALQAAEKRRCSKAQEALDVVESRMDRARSRIFSVTSRDVMQTIRDELAVITTALRNVKYKVSCIVSRRSQLEGSCNDMHKLLCDKEDALSVSSEPIEFDSCKFCSSCLCPSTKIHEAHHFDLPIDLCDEVAQISLFLGAVSVVIFGISRRHGEFFMGVLALILGLAMEAQNPHSESRRQNTLSQIPRSMETALSRFKLDGQTTAYAVCPACNCTYRPTTSLNSSHARYPTKCFNRPIPEDGPCDEPLLQPSADGKLEPIKIFLYHHFHDYLAGLLSRPDLEVLMDRPCDDLLASIGSPPHIIKDVWDANFFRTFKGPSGQSLFIDRGTEGRYAFTLNVDFFNIEGNLQRNASTSTGIISCACLNLPLDIRYKSENMYLAGIIPGPSEPSGDELNHFLDPVVDDMVESWERGIRYSRTALHSPGRVTRSVIACLVCDLPAARKAAQLAGPTSHFYCTACHCWHRSTCGRTDIQTEDWVLRDKNEVRRYAELWKNAETSVERNKLFSLHGVRWSTLWRLSYWDPSRQIVVDTMHCLLEGLAHAHFREFLGLTADSANRKSDVVPAFKHPFLDVNSHKPPEFNEKDVRAVQSIHSLLTEAVPDLEGSDPELIEDHVVDLERRLLTKKVACLQFVSVGLGIEPEVTHPGKKVYKIHWVRSLLAWVGISIVLFSYPLN
jgi:Transposase family tnp2